MINYTFLLISMPLLLLIVLVAVVNITMGLSNFMVLTKAYAKRHKNFVVVSRYTVDLKTKYYLGEILSNQIKFKDDTGSEVMHNIHSDAFYRILGRINAVDYFENDINPRSPRNHNSIPIHPLEHAKALKIAVKSEVNSIGDTWIRKHWWKVALVVIAGYGILGFVAINQQATITELALKLAGTVVVQGV